MPQVPYPSLAFARWTSLGRAGSSPCVMAFPAGFDY